MVRAIPARAIPFPPMEAELVRELPVGDGWQYEPKWDGFRGVFENCGKELAMWSRNERPLLRYFPELRPLGDLLAPKSALDGEIVIARDGVLDFDAMQMRLHPAESRVKRLSAEIPAEFVVFDVLVWDGEPVWKLPLEERRARVEALKGFRLSPATQDIDEARGWLERFESLGLDGVIAKKLGVPYLPGSRDGVVKVKEHKSADCVVIGFRWKDDRSAIATLLLGLYRDGDNLQMVGGAASFTAKDRLKLLADLEPLREGDEVREGDPSRWNSAADKRWIPVRPEKVCEVAYDQMEGNTVHGKRFRHAVKFVRWRPDRDPTSCTFEQLDVPITLDLYDVLEVR